MNGYLLYLSSYPQLKFTPGNELVLIDRCTLAKVLPFLFTLLSGGLLRGGRSDSHDSSVGPLKIDGFTILSIMNQPFP